MCECMGRSICVEVKGQLVVFSFYHVSPGMDSLQAW